MRSLSKRIMELAEALPEAEPIYAKRLLHLGSRAAVDQSLSRLARSGRLLRVCQGIYMRPIESKFGLRPPVVGMVIASLAALWGQTIVPSGGDAANRLRLTTQMPVRYIYLTSGPGRRLQLFKLTVELRHAPGWQLVLPNRRAGYAIRALACMGHQEAESAVARLERVLSDGDLAELASVRAGMPSWMAESVSKLVTAHG